MNAKDIQRYLSLLGEELEAIGVSEPIQLLLVGGGYMLTQVKNSRSVTGDIDTVWLAPEMYAGSEIYRLFKGAIQFVADDEKLVSDWLNVGVGDFVRAAGPLPHLKLWKKFNVLHVYLPPKDFVLAHKLLAGREKDKSDIEVLCKLLKINRRVKAQEILDKYIYRDIQDNNRIDIKLAIFFRE